MTAVTTKIKEDASKAEVPKISMSVRNIHPAASAFIKALKVRHKNTVKMPKLNLDARSSHGGIGSGAVPSDAITALTTGNPDSSPSYTRMRPSI